MADLKQDFKDRFVKKLQGNDFVLYGGLMELAHQKGIKGIKTQIIQSPHKENENTAIVHAIATDKDGNEWHGIGDCNDKNANNNIKPHKIRMAETRAKGRALRDLCNIDMCMVEELGSLDDISNNNTTQKAKTTKPSTPKKTKVTKPKKQTKGKKEFESVDVNRIVEFKAILNIEENSGLNPLIEEWSGGELNDFNQLDKDNIKAFNAFLKTKV